MPDTALGGSSLAARCTACSTVFRVVPDQLRVSEGWVRCGRCSQVFNAAQNLIDLDTGAPRRLDLGLAARAEPATDPTPAMALPPARNEAEASVQPPPLRPQPTPDAAPWESEPADTAMAATLPLYGPAESRPSALEPEPPATPTLPVAPPAALQTESLPAPVADPPPAAVLAAAPPSVAAPVVAQPSFVRQADRAARWQRPHVRAALAGASALAALMLVFQIGFAYRDLAAARWPTLRPALQAGCALLGCSVGPAQSIEALTVESSGLLRVEQTRLYQLTVGLRNRADIALAVPALELSLTDAQGRLLSRRVLRAAELGASQPTVAAGSDLTLQATLQTAPLSTDEAEAAVVVGYTIELFYP